MFQARTHPPPLETVPPELLEDTAAPLRSDDNPVDVPPVEDDAEDVGMPPDDEDATEDVATPPDEEEAEELLEEDVATAPELLDEDTLEGSDEDAATLEPPAGPEDASAREERGSSSLRAELPPADDDAAPDAAWLLPPALDDEEDTPVTPLEPPPVPAGSELQ